MPSLGLDSRSDSLSSEQAASQKQVDDESTTNDSATLENTSRIARDFQGHLHCVTNHSEPKSAEQELTELQERLRRRLSREEYDACCAVHDEFQQYLKLKRIFEIQSRRKREYCSNDLRFLCIGADPKTENHDAVARLVQTPIPVIAIDNALNTLRNAHAGIQISIEQALINIRARTLELLQGIDWREVLSDLALFILQRGRDLAVDLATFACHAIIVVGGQQARETWDALRGIWNNTRAAGGWAKQIVTQKLEERRAKRKRDEVEEAEQQEDYVPIKCVRLGVGYLDPANLDFDTPAPEKPIAAARDNVVFLPTHSGHTVEDHYWRDDIIIASRIAIAYPKLIFDPKLLRSCQVDLADLGSIDAQWDIAGDHIFDITPHPTEFQASKNGMWEVINGVI